MQVNITGRHVEITPALRRYVEEKAERLHRYFDRATRLQVTLRVEGERHIAEMILATVRGVTLIGEEVAGDMYAAVDLVTDKLGRQLRKLKTRMRLNGRRHTLRGTISLPGYGGAAWGTPPGEA